jgi:ACS family hexuronate transporter-like MFS transporter
LGALPLGFVLYASALYLSKPLGCSQEFIGRVLWIPPLGWEAGYFFWGWLADRRKHSTRSLILMCAALSLPFVAIPLVRSVPVVLLLMWIAMFSASGFVVLSVTYANTVYNSEYAGFIAGVGAGSWSAVVGIMMPYFGKLFDSQQYSTAFWVAASFPLAGFLGWLFLSRVNIPKS